MSDPRDRQEPARGTLQVPRRETPAVPPTGPNVVVDLAPTPRATPRQPAPTRGYGLVVIVYIVAIAALAASIYARWFASS